MTRDCQEEEIKKGRRNKRRKRSSFIVDYEKEWKARHGGVLEQFSPSISSKGSHEWRGSGAVVKQKTLGTLTPPMPRLSVKRLSHMGLNMPRHRTGRAFLRDGGSC